MQNMKNLVTLIVILYSMILLCNGCGTYESGVNNQEQDYIVNENNNLRIELANGRVEGQPRAVNLLRFSWDEYLAGEAQNIANTCVFGHQPVQDDRFSVGQNIFSTSSTNYEAGSNWTAAIYGWWDEYTQYTYPNNPEDNTGHYTQMAWDDTYKIGCGYAYYPIEGEFPYQKYYVCNYGPAGNFPRAPYQTGDSGCENLCDPPAK